MSDRGGESTTLRSTAVPVAPPRPPGATVRPAGATVRPASATVQCRIRDAIAWSAAAAVVLAVLYGSTLRELVSLWASASYYSYGALVPIWSAWVAVTDRSKVAAIPARRDATGLALAGLGLAVLAVARANDSLTLATLSLPLVLAGLGRFTLGREAFRPLAFPVAFLALMTPLPPSVIPEISWRLQTLAAWFTEGVLRALAIPFVRNGVFIHLERTIVHVSEACNGLRFLLAMAVLGVAFGWTTGRGPLVRVAFLGGALVAGVLANLIRVAGTTVLVQLWGPAAALGAFHILFGKTIYVLTLGAVFLLAWRLRAPAGEPWEAVASTSSARDPQAGMRRHRQTHP